VRLPPVLVVSAGVVFTSFSAIFIRFSDSPPLIIAAYRMWFTTILVAPMLIRELVRERRTLAGQPPDARPPQADGARGSAPPVVLLSIISGVALSIHFAAWISSLSYTSVASSTVLVTTHPIIVAVAGFFVFKERLTWRAALFMLVALLGGAVLVVGGIGAGGSAPTGNLLAFLGAVTVSGYMLIGRVVRQHLSASKYTFIVYGVAAVLLTIYAIIAGNPLFGYSARELLLFLALAVVCTLLGHSLFNWALRFMSPTVISTSILGEPVISSALAALLFAEIPTVFTIIGGVIILLAIFLFVTENNRSKQKG
jgi:drug/metabolite transporter (DMT)-like permease